MKTPAPTRDWSATPRARPWSRRWVVREADKGVVAFAIAWHVVDELHLLNLATRLDRRRLGHGRALTNALVGYARAHNVRQVFLEVRVTNASAIRLYRRVGFVGIGRRNGYYPDGEDALDMVLRLDPQTGAVVPGTDDVTLP